MATACRRRDETGKILSFEIISDPADSDTDKDGIPDSEEKKIGTNQDSVDTDGDGISDFQEVIMGTDPKVKDDFTTKK